MNRHTKYMVLTSLLTPTVYASTSREITFDVMQLEPKQEEIFYGKLSQFFKDNSVPDGKEMSITFETKAPGTIAITDILNTGNYEIRFVKGGNEQKENYRGKEQYAELIECFANDGSIDLRLYDKLKSLTLEKELLDEVSKFERIDKDNPKKLIEACLRTVKMNAIERYKTVDDLVETTFIEKLCKIVGRMDNVENLQNGIWFCTDIPIDNVTDEELYNKIWERINAIA